MASDGSSPRRLSSSPAEYPSWSPDGSRIAFSLVTAGAVQIGIVRRDGQGERTLTPLTENSELPAWSPDGSLIAFSRGFEGRRTIWTIKARRRRRAPDHRTRKRRRRPGLVPRRPIHRFRPAPATNDHARRRIRRSLARPPRLAARMDVVSPIDGCLASSRRRHRRTARPGLTSRAREAPSEGSLPLAPPGGRAAQSKRRSAVEPVARLTSAPRARGVPLPSRSSGVLLRFRGSSNPGARPSRGRASASSERDRGWCCRRARRCSTRWSPVRASS